MRTHYMGMDSRHLETLLWVVRLGGIGAAAQHLNLTQPAVTRRIQELERELGAKVFRRQGRNVALTPVGQTCLGSAERILSEVATMRVAASGKAAVGTIRVGVVESIALTWFQNFLARIEERYPRWRSMSIYRTDCSPSLPVVRSISRCCPARCNSRGSCACRSAIAT